MAELERSEKRNSVLEARLQDMDERNQSLIAQLTSAGAELLLAQQQLASLQGPSVP
jgi:hypothetical protein